MGSRRGCVAETRLIAPTEMLWDKNDHRPSGQTFDDLL
jgi:hypothetical protein